MIVFKILNYTSDDQLALLLFHTKLPTLVLSHLLFPLPETVFHRAPCAPAHTCAHLLPFAYLLLVPKAWINAISLGKEASDYLE